jgi:hypothetical protein
MRNEGITDRPVPPWQLPGAVRRDCEPHRGPLVQGACRTASALSCLLAFAPLYLLPGLFVTRWWPQLLWGVPLLPLVGFLASLAAWAVARHDLALIRAGRMDPAGRPGAEEGWLWGVQGMVTAACSFALCWLVLFVIRVGT